MKRRMIITVCVVGAMSIATSATAAIIGRSFDDVPEDHLFAADIAWAKDHGIVFGYGDGNFGPEDFMTRGQLTAVMHRYHNAFGGEGGTDGAQGPQGEQGLQGIPGAPGLPGPQGEQGIQGDTGAEGAQGIQGEQGPKGDTGATGPQGEQGIQGEKGDTGPAGPAGGEGRDGKDGGLNGVYTANGSFSGKTGTALCDDGDIVLGGGFVTGSAVGGSYPNATGTGWIVERSSANGDTDVVYARCADVTP